MRQDSCLIRPVGPEFANVNVPDVIKTRRVALRLSQSDLARQAGVSVRQLSRYEAGEQQPTLSAAVQLAEALGISLAQLAGQVDYGLDLSGAWFCSWQTWKDGKPRVDTHALEVSQRGETLDLDADRAIPVSQGSYRWAGELRLWDHEALIGWYRSTDAAVRSKGSLYLALHRHGTHAWGRWVGMSYDGDIITGWGSIARDEEHAPRIVQDLLDKE